MFDHIKIYTSSKCLAHDTPSGHPERAERLQVLLDLLDTPPYNAIARPELHAASDDDILKVHSAAHLAVLKESSPCEPGEHEYIDGDTIMSQGSFEAAYLAAGAVVDAVSDIHAGRNKIGLCMNRPPGHHATHNQAMGFCLLNNVMIGVAKAAELGYQRIAVVDFDVHHGNGCSDILDSCALPCFYISSHQDGHYPGTGRIIDNVPDKILNIPLPAGSSAKQICLEYKNSVFPALNNYKPDFVFISAGFDGHKKDPYGDFNLLEGDYYWLSHEIYKIAKNHAKSRLVSVLEGGYDLKALKASYGAHINAFRNNDI